MRAFQDNNIMRCFHFFAVRATTAMRVCQHSPERAGERHKKRKANAIYRLKE